MTSMNTRWIRIPALDGSPIDAYLALPPRGEGPGLVLWQEIFGVNGHIRTVAEQYAQAGFVVLVPDAFWRQQRRVELGYVGADRDHGMALMKAYTPAEQEADVQAATAALRALPEVGGRKVGALGYCMGGRLAYLCAAMAGVDAAVSYYGGGIQTRLELAPRVSAPMLFHYAGHDAAIPPEAVAQVQQALAGKAAQFHVYAAAQHGFNCWDRAAYEPGSAALALGRSLTFLAEHLFG